MTTNSQLEHRRLAHPSAARDVLLVGSPIIVMGVIGNLVGVETLLGGLLINLGYLVMIFLGARMLRMQGSSWQSIGLKTPDSWLSTFCLGAAGAVGAVALFIAVQGAAIGLLTFLGGASAELDQSRFNPLEGNFLLFALMVVLAWTTIAFGEELFYRSFLITRLIDHSGMKPANAILIAGLVFGAIHFAEGPVGILANTSFGVLFGWIFIRSSRNLWVTVISHGLINTLRFLILYAGLA